MNTESLGKLISTYKIYKSFQFENFHKSYKRIEKRQTYSYSVTFIESEFPDLVNVAPFIFYLNESLQQKQKAAIKGRKTWKTLPGKFNIYKWLLCWYSREREGERGEKNKKQFSYKQRIFVT